MSPVVADVAGLVPHLGRPVLVAVDGGDGAGKTRFADSLAAALAERGRTVGRGGVDDYLNPPDYRHAQGRTPQTVWDRTTDLGRLRDELLEPWLARDDDAVLVVDGIFAQRPELRAAWDLVVWLEVPDDVRVSRLAARDHTPDDPAHPDQARYLGAQRIYRDTCDPAGRADVVVDNTDHQRPQIVRPSAAR